MNIIKNIIRIALMSLVFFTNLMPNFAGAMLRRNSEFLSFQEPAQAFVRRFSPAWMLTEAKRHTSTQTTGTPKAKEWKFDPENGMYYVGKSLRELCAEQRTSLPLVHDARKKMVVYGKKQIHPPIRK